MKRFLVILLLGLLLLASGCMFVPEKTEPTTLPTVTSETTLPPETTVHVHSYTAAVTPPSCTEEGFTAYTCSCGDSYIQDRTAPLGHDETAAVTQASEEAPGCTTYTCRRCGESRQENFTWLAATPTDFFDDAAFIGDSITIGLRNYLLEHPYLGKASILCQGSYSVDHAVNNSMLISYQGDDWKPQELLKACGAKKVFILLGMNDIALHGVDKTMENWSVLLSNIRTACPDIQIYIQSGTPIYTPGQIGGLNNTRMDEYNRRLQIFAQENGCHYIDVATSLKDDTNGLARGYTTDAYVHLTYSACKLWVEILKNFVGQ